MDINALIEYYVNLIIIQYSDKPKAQATIRALVDVVLANGILFDIRDGYNIDTAVGVQLDIIGKYVGVDRFFEVNDPIDYFSLVDYAETTPYDEQKHGFTDYADWEDFQFNGTINYNSVLSQTNRLNDDDYRVIIKLKILQNNINHSHKSIDDGVFEFFGADVRPDSLGDMQMTYFITSNITAVALAALTKKLLPRPMGVGLSLIKNVDGAFFGFLRYDRMTPDEYQVGFQRYADYGTTEGQTLTYNQMEVVDG